MYICDDCGSVFEEDDLKEVKEWSEAWGHPVYESFYYCPFCGSDDYHAYRDPEIDDDEDWQPTDEQHEKWLKKVDDLIAKAKAMKGET